MLWRERRSSPRGMCITFTRPGIIEYVCHWILTLATSTTPVDNQRDPHFPSTNRCRTRGGIAVCISASIRTRYICEARVHLNPCGYHVLTLSFHPGSSQNPASWLTECPGERRDRALREGTLGADCIRFIDAYLHSLLLLNEPWPRIPAYQQP